MSPTPLLRARDLGRKFRRRWALSGCHLDVPAGRITGLVGPNGAGKTTLLSLAAGLLTPTSGTIEVCGGRPGSRPADVGFVAQNTPVYGRLTVAEHLELGARLNAGWDMALATERIARLGLRPGQRAGSLSGGGRAQLALTLALAKRPRVLILDEPVASLDPLARHDFLRELKDATERWDLSVLHSSHLVSDVELLCDYLIVLVASRVRVAGDVRELLATHHLVESPAPAGAHVVSAGPGTTLVRADAPPPGTVGTVGLEQLVLAYLEAHR
ncbi:ABC transporter ATP-binding protein [Streptomyces hoynatensis]|uniref:ABC transporter ATP-binding protein n=1 Tax=Streptomyces hoynatensis TaxID=1141874 RepID=A0A3A9Z3X7_9ACTN|nr:ABC transporter ATP-binding protein [Streptomyces hoynatensis]RKN43131.1 ABC transporter ATP-binding protein [Streptomyces hoynatensis]